MVTQQNYSQVVYAVLCSKVGFYLQEVAQSIAFYLLEEFPTDSLMAGLQYLLVSLAIANNVLNELFQKQSMFFNRIEIIPAAVKNKTGVRNYGRSKNSRWQVLTTCDSCL